MSNEVGSPAPRAGRMREIVKRMLRPLRLAAGRFALPGLEGLIAGSQLNAARVADLERQIRELELRLADRVASERTTTNASIAATAQRQNEERQARLRELGARLTVDVDRTRSRKAVADETFVELQLFRQTGEYAAGYDDPRPLVTVAVVTYNRAELLIERCLPSILNQTYDNLQIVVVGDACTDDSGARVAALGDERVSFVDFRDHQLPVRLSGGCEAANVALDETRGTFITFLDDDDEYVDDRIARLVDFARDTKAEFIWHPFWWQERPEARPGDPPPDDPWSINEARELEFASVTTGSVFYHHWFGRIAWDPLSSRYGAPPDWTLFRTIRDLGAVAARYPEPLLRHHKEGLNPRWTD